MKLILSKINQHSSKTLIFGCFYLTLVPSLLVYDKKILFFGLVVFQLFILIYAFSDPLAAFLLHMIILITLILNVVKRSL